MVEENKPKLDSRYVVSIQGNDFVLYDGLLDYAHQKGLKSLAVKILQYPTKDNNNTAICEATIITQNGESFTDIGDANPDNCKKNVADHFIRMASTRAKARVLRDFNNIGLEVCEEHESTPPPRQEAKTKTTKEQNGKITDAQLTAINNMAKQRGLKPSDIDRLAKDNIGATVKELSVADASRLIKYMQRMESK